MVKNGLLGGCETAPLISVVPMELILKEGIKLYFKFFAPGSNPALISVVPTELFLRLKIMFVLDFFPVSNLIIVPKIIPLFPFSAFHFFTLCLQLFKPFKTLDTIPASKNVTF